MNDEKDVWTICKSCIYLDNCIMSGYINTKNFNKSGCNDYTQKEERRILCLDQ